MNPRTRVRRNRDFSFTSQQWAGRIHYCAC